MYHKFHDFIFFFYIFDGFEFLENTYTFILVWAQHRAQGSSSDFKSRSEET